MKSEPPTPTRAPDDQLRQMQYYLNVHYNHQFTTFLGLGSGVPIPSVILRNHARPGLALKRAVWGRRKGGLVNLRFIIFLNVPYLNICLLVRDSGLRLFTNIEGIRKNISRRFTTPSPSSVPPSRPYPRPRRPAVGGWGASDEDST